MPVPILALAALASSAFQAYQGIKQQRQADAIDAKRPTYQMPDSVKQATGIAQNMATSAMPGFGQNLARIGANTASTIRAAQQSGSANNALAVIAAAGDNQNNATNSLYVQNAQFQRQGQQALLGQLARQGQYEDKEFDYNQAQPYNNAAAAKSALTEASAKNLNNGIAGIGTSFGSLASGGQTGGDDGIGGYNQLNPRGPSQVNTGLGAYGRIPKLR